MVFPSSSVKVNRHQFLSQDWETAEAMALKGRSASPASAAPWGAMVMVPEATSRALVTWPAMPERTASTR